MAVQTQERDVKPSGLRQRLELPSHRIEFDMERNVVADRMQYDVPRNLICFTREEV